MADDPLNHDRRTLGVVDGALTQASLGLVCLLPTLLAVLFRPGLLKSQIGEIQDKGHQGLLLAPGPFFVIGFLCSLIAVSVFAPQAEGAIVAMGEDVRTAAGAGQFWTVVSVGAPLLLGALGLGLIFFLAGQVLQLAERSLTACLRAAQYGFLGSIVVMAVAEPASALIGPSGDNGVYEPVIFLVTGVWMAAFHFALLSSAADRLWVRLGACAAVGVLAGSLSLAPYLL